MVVLRATNDARVVLTQRADWIVTPGSDAADEPRDMLVSRNLPLTCAEIPGSTYDELFCTAALLRAGQILGAIEWTFRRTVEFAMERKQFGREIGKFQAIQQMLAELADHALASAAITEAAAAEGSKVLIAAARSRLGDAADVAIRIGHQVHGAIGFSREYALNFRTRRLMAWRDDYGSIAYWTERVGERFLGLTRDAVWPLVTDTKADATAG
jgi:acyl-CoA dehydrogenase